MSAPEPYFIRDPRTGRLVEVVERLVTSPGVQKDGTCRPFQYVMVIAEHAGED